MLLGEVRGQFRPGASLLVANHVSWLDILAVHAACPRARFVSKADVLHWPLLGWLIRGAGTLFIERDRKRDALRAALDLEDAEIAQFDDERIAGMFPADVKGLVRVALEGVVDDIAAAFFQR